VGTPAEVDALLTLSPALGGLFPTRWDLPPYSDDELAQIAVRHLLRRGHEVPDEVRVALRALASRLPSPTAYAAHRMAAAVARTASCTLTVADLGGVAGLEPVTEGLASVS
jgi:hypothetical protein